MLIGVDHGNKQIKTVHCNPFVSGLKQSVTRPFGQNVLRYQNTYYTLSTERIPYRKDKTEDDRFFILTLFALAGEIEARGAYSSEVQRIQLAVGLPPAHFGAQVERFTQYFGQRGNRSSSEFTLERTLLYNRITPFSNESQEVRSISPFFISR